MDYRISERGDDKMKVELNVDQFRVLGKPLLNDRSPGAIWQKRPHARPFNRQSQG